MVNLNKKKILKFTIGIFVLIIFLITIRIFSKNLENQAHFIKIAGQTIQVDLALTEAEQTRGLAGRKELSKNRGMLFVFQRSSPNYFWMREMLIPIDIIWIDENFQVIFIEKNVPPESYPKTFGPTQASKYVLEVNSGFSEENNLKIGEKVKFLP